MLIIYHIEADILQMAVILFSSMETDFFNTNSFEICYQESYW